MKKTILVVEDEEMMLNSMRLILKMSGYKVETAKDGMEAFNKIIDAEKKEKQFDLIIIDVLMPGLDGLELLNKLSHKEIIIPVVVVTECTDSKMMFEMIQKGCDLYLTRPIEQSTLIDHVNSIFIK